ncbi:thymidylate synthase [Bacillus cereus]|uniref:thymidylate synthase n=1 Tax=Bacillus cereus TaxID=1396 RepID=UPI000BF90DD4|nr:thymidylate synthase [Bacillus cereus]PFB64341.1 thymidylate synthase [Bacillus cereus]
MALIDDYQKDTLKLILSQEWTPDNRAVWEDGSPIATKRIFGVVNRYDLSKEFPAPTTRPLPLKTIFDEVDWIYRKRSNNVNDMKAKIWNQWAFKKTRLRFSKSFPFVRLEKKGSIGKAYGYQVAKPIHGYDNQMDYVLGELKRDPFTRRAIIEMWNVDDRGRMNLPPCAHHLQFWSDGKKTNLILKQRSQDFVTANAFNVCEYAILLHMVARHIGQDAGELLHIIGDCHIYNKHLELAEELVKREPYAAPTLWINPEKTDFYSFTADDFRLENYEKHPQMKIEVAV